MKTYAAFAVALGLFASAPMLAQAQSGPVANPDAPENSVLKAPHANKPGAPAKGHNSFTRSQARQHIQKEGYTQVTSLVKDKDGLWQGRAMKDGKKVGVALDFQGNVTNR